LALDGTVGDAEEAPEQRVREQGALHPHAPLGGDIHDGGCHFLEHGSQAGKLLAIGAHGKRRPGRNARQKSQNNEQRPTAVATGGHVDPSSKIFLDGGGRKAAVYLETLHRESSAGKNKGGLPRPSL